MTSWAVYESVLETPFDYEIGDASEWVASNFCGVCVNAWLAPAGLAWGYQRLPKTPHVSMKRRTRLGEWEFGIGWLGYNSAIKLP